MISMSPDEAYRRTYILPVKIAIAGPEHAMTEENVNLIIRTLSNVLIYTKEASKAIKDLPRADEFKKRIKQIAVLAKANYLKAQRITGLTGYII